MEASQSEIAAKNREMEDDLRMAREVQVAMLPHEFPACRTGNGTALRFAHLYEPAGGVGGDFFDVLPVSDTAAGILICDVMGHGVRSALITAMVRTTIEELRPLAGDPARVLTQLNAHLTRLLQRTGDVIFVTAAYAVVDAASGQCSYAQAGHPTPLHWSREQARVSALSGAKEIGGPALGLMKDSIYEAVTISFGLGDRLLFFTDGIIEASNAREEEFGVDRLAATLQVGRNDNLNSALAGLKAEVEKFTGGRPFGDDVCLVACEFGI